MKLIDLLNVYEDGIVVVDNVSGERIYDGDGQGYKDIHCEDSDYDDYIIESIEYGNQCLLIYVRPS